MEIKKLLIANRGEIAIRIARAATELGIATVAIYTYEDRFSLHRYKADEAYQIGDDNDPLKPYLNIEEIIRIAQESGSNAIHPGYGFLSENADFAQQVTEAGLLFIGPSAQAMRALGDKVSAKEAAIAAKIPIIESNIKALTSEEIALEEANRIGYPLMIKAAAGGGGRGMRVVRNDEDLKKAFREARSEAKNAFGNDTVFIEKYVENPKHIEVQIVGDKHGHLVHLYERDCSVQRRFQKVVEFAPSVTLKDETLQKLYQYALDIAAEVDYNNVGTVEFLVDAEENIYFIEVNTRIQVEHTVTELITGVDLIRTQLYIAQDYPLSSPEIGLGDQQAIPKTGVAIQCRITTEDPQNDFKPDYGTLVTYRNAGGFGIRLDEGSTYVGMKISPFFDSMLVKVCAHGTTLADASAKMMRALKEMRIRGVKNNILFLENLIGHPIFQSGDTNVGFIAEHPELFSFSPMQDRATKLMKYIADVIVNGNPEVSDKKPSIRFEKPIVPPFSKGEHFPEGSKQLLDSMGPERFSEWIRQENKVFYTDTTFRDAHQSILATRVRTYDMLNVAEGFAKDFPSLFSMEVWGGATFDVCMRFLKEDPWQRLIDFRKAIPNILLQMLIRGTNGLGYAAYPDNLIETFVEKSWESGIDVFRIFDSLNWMKNMAPCIEMVRKRTNGIAEGTICYTGDIVDPKRTKYTLEYYLKLAKELEDAGAHMLGIKDMAGLLKPAAAKLLVSALKETVKLPIHLHTHDTSSLQCATYLEAINVGVDIVDCALGSVSGQTSQPSLNSVAEMMRFHPRENPINIASLNDYSDYWESVRKYYYSFEADFKGSRAQVFEDEIPGGQFSNLKRQADALGLGTQFYEVTKMYTRVNRMFGDIIKVTPSSKVVGDMAQFMVSNKLDPEDIYSKGDTLNFPESVKDFFLGKIGQPVGGFPEDLQKIILRDEQPFTDRPNQHLEPVDFDRELADFQDEYGKELTLLDFLSYKFYPKVFKDYLEHKNLYGDVSVLPTPLFLYGMQPGEDASIKIATGKTLLVQFSGYGPTNEEKGTRTLFFKLNGQTRPLEVLDKSIKVTVVENRKADAGNPKEIAVPLRGMISKISVKAGQEVKKNQPLFVIEAMKMETTITAMEDAVIDAVVLSEGTLVNVNDLVLVLR
ncbi:pyruvate carboxylase [Olivibacter sitiensis]|uniref:pyruvate carboxylase n=1 Tax=Olivibacter sitiensis TaxID=376470 RepID=UPI00041A7A23|nr:pyruvate carboxylase [Olivibacter sitiensis]